MNLRDYLFHEEPGITLYCGDCREVLPLLEPAELVIADPPFNVGLKYGSQTDDRRADYWEWLASRLRGIPLQDSATLYCFQADANLETFCA